MIAYRIDNNVYLNLTNRCSNNCSFCVRTTSDFYKQYDLWLAKEPTADEVMAAIREQAPADEYVFCGYGEPLCAFDTLLEVAKRLKAMGKKTRLNTNGQADLIVGKGVAHKLKGLVDKVSISLNAENAQKYNEICACDYGEEGYKSLLRFAEDCKKEGLNAAFSVVRTPDTDVDAVQKVADRVGLPLRVRELIV